MPHLGYHSRWSDKLEKNKSRCRSRTTRHILRPGRTEPFFFSISDNPLHSLLQRLYPWIPFYDDRHKHTHTHTHTSLLCTIMFITFIHTDSGMHTHSPTHIHTYTHARTQALNRTHDHTHFIFTQLQNEKPKKIKIHATPALYTTDYGTK